MQQLNEFEICTMYRNAKNPKQQITILAQMNLVDKEAICEILRRHGCLVGEDCLPEKRPKWDAKDIELLCKMVAEKKKYKEIADAFGVSVATIGKKIQQTRREVGDNLPSDPQEGIMPCLEDHQPVDEAPEALMAVNENEKVTNLIADSAQMLQQVMAAFDEGLERRAFFYLGELRRLIIQSGEELGIELDRIGWWPNEKGGNSSG